MTFSFTFKGEVCTILLALVSPQIRQQRLRFKRGSLDLQNTIGFVWLGKQAKQLLKKKEFWCQKSDKIPSKKSAKSLTCKQPSKDSFSSRLINLNMNLIRRCSLLVPIYLAPIPFHLETSCE